MAKMKKGINIWIKTKIETVQIKLKETQSKKQPSNQTKKTKKKKKKKKKKKNTWKN